MNGISFLNGQPSGGLFEEQSTENGSVVILANGTFLFNHQISLTLEVNIEIGSWFRSNPVDIPIPIDALPGTTDIFVTGSRTNFGWDLFVQNIASNRPGIAAQQFMVIAGSSRINQQITVRIFGIGKADI